ncbi:MAG TPA: hypothetical protein VN081_05105 [Dongiaceae bacterium]|nr:hypothetical protein [Dongiaceae bacterium]
MANRSRHNRPPQSPPKDWRAPSETLKIFAAHPDPARHTPAFKIFNYPFKCTIQSIHLMSEEWLRDSGLIISGINEIDRTALMGWVPCHMKIYQMAEFVEEGVSIRLMDPNDAPKIFHIIQQHLADHARAAQYDINKSKVPVDDLRKLDALAEMVYPISRGMEASRTPVENEFHKRLREFGSRGFLSTQKTGEPPKEKPFAYDPGYQSQMPELQKQLSQRSKPWLKHS